MGSSRIPRTSRANQVAAIARTASRTATANKSRSQSATIAAGAGAGERASPDRQGEQEQEERMNADFHPKKRPTGKLQPRIAPLYAQGVKTSRCGSAYNGRMRVIAGSLRSRQLHRPAWHGDASHQRPAARDALQHSGAADCGMPLRRPLCGHGRGGDRGDQPRRDACVVRGTGGAGAGGDPRQFEGAAD